MEIVARELKALKAVFEPARGVLACLSKTGMV